MKTQSVETKTILEASKKLLSRDQPMTLRHLFYLLVSVGVVDNTERAYKRLARIIAIARKGQQIEFECLVDNLRTRIKPSSWTGLADFAEEASRSYRKDFWAAQSRYLEFWIEKDAIAGVINDLSWQYDVRIRPLRGYSSLTFLHQAALELSQVRKPISIYYLGDHDPSGRDIERAAREGLNSLFAIVGVPPEPVSWKRLALNPSDLKRFAIVPLAAKSADARYRAFANQYGVAAAELDALPPSELRNRVESTIRSHIEPDQWLRLQTIEDNERRSFEDLMKVFRGR